MSRTTTRGRQSRLRREKDILERIDMAKYIKLEDAIGYECPLNEIWEDCINCPLNNGGSEVCKLGKWLKSLPTIEVSEDCISREWLIKALDNLDWYDFDMFYKVVENAPSVVPTVRKNRTVEQSSKVGERKRGEWRTSTAHSGIVKCSVCGYQAGAYAESKEYKFCPNCGVDMRGAECQSEI